MSDKKTSLELELEEQRNPDLLDRYDEVLNLLEMAKLPLAKAVRKGTKQAGVSARRALREAQRMLKEISSESLVVQRKVKASRPPHGNTNGPGIRAMQEARQRKLEAEREEDEDEV